MTQQTRTYEDSPQPRAMARINSKLEKNLGSYLAAAGAAGMGVMALSQPAAAHIVYTPANTNIAFPSSLALDLNNDGITDFNINFYEGDKSAILAVSVVGLGNGVRLNAGGYPAPGFFGVPVGPGEHFNSQQGINQLMALAGSYGGSQFSFGAWLNVTNRYLGLRFVVNGQTHYGWARLNSNVCCGAVVLTGYAYETIPNKGIKDGAISGPADIVSLSPTERLAPVSQPGNLGLLARGAEGIAIWRREEDSPSN